MFCGDYIMELLRQNGGVSTRGTLRDLLLKQGYGTEAIRQAYLRLEAAGKIELLGSGRSKSQIVKMKGYMENV